MMEFLWCRGHNTITLEVKNTNHTTMSTPPPPPLQQHHHQCKLQKSHEMRAYRLSQRRTDGTTEANQPQGSPRTVEEYEL